MSKLFYSYLINLIIICTVTINLYSFPYQFRRLILEKNGNIIKTVDLISDFHHPVDEIIHRISKKRKKFLSPLERRAFTTSERTFLATIRALDIQPYKRQLLWELRQDELKDYPVTIKDIFLLYGGFILNKEFHQLANKNILFNDADTYRAQIGELAELATSSVSEEVEKKILYTITENLSQFISQTSPLLKDLKQVKQVMNQDTYLKVESLIFDYLSRLKIFYENTLLQALQKNPNITIKQFLITKEFDKFINQGHDLLNVELFDLELLLKIFSSTYNHLIIYAGGDHCNFLAKILMMQFNFKMVINIGTTIKSEPLRFAELSPTAWDYLKEDPVYTFERYKKNNKPIEQKLKKEIFKEFNNIINAMQNTAKVYNFDTPNMYENKFIDQIYSFLKKGWQAHVNLLITRDDDGNTLLHHAIQNNLINIALFLLQHTASANSQNYALNTPLHIALNSANITEKKLPTIIKLLLRYGADPSIKNEQGQTPSILSNKIENKIIFERLH